MTTLVVVKYPADARVVTVDFTPDLVNGETIGAYIVGASLPSGITISAASQSGSLVSFTAAAGTDGQSYSINVAVNTNQGHTYTRVVAIVVSSQLAANYQNRNPDAFATLVDTLQAGEAAIGKALFVFPAGFDSSNGSVSWELVDAAGVVLNNGQAYSYVATVLANGVRIEGEAVISVPSDVLPTLDGQSYQIRWTLTINGQPYFTFENLTVTGNSTVPQGSDDVVELEGFDLPLSIVLPAPYDAVSVAVYKDNTLVMASTPLPQGTRTPNGWVYQTLVAPTSDMVAQLEAYTLVWSAKNQANQTTDRQIGRLFVVNPSMLTASEDMKLTLSKARTTVYGQADILFSTPLLLAYLRRGRDAFNASYGVPTAFTFTAAAGPLREFWLKFSEVLALRSQFLAEGERVFNFSGQTISLDSDRTSYYDQLAGSIQQILDNEVKPFKTMLVKRGILGGDGNVFDLTAQQPGAAGAVGITITPASGWVVQQARLRGGYKM